MSAAWAGKVAVVTGAASGIGEATARLLAERGAAVVLVDLGADALEAGAERLAAAGGRVLALPADVCDASAVRRLAVRADEAFGRVDLLANIAGILRRHASLADWPVEEFRRVIDVNLTSGFIMAQAFAPLIARSGGGAIVNIASTAALNPTPTTPAYAASKSGVLGLTRTLAAMLAAERVRVNAILPDHVDTPMMRDSPLRGARPSLAARDVARAVLHAATSAGLSGAFLRIAMGEAGPVLSRVQDPPPFDPTPFPD